jgi:hypothetical protein
MRLVRIHPIRQRVRQHPWRADDDEVLIAVVDAALKNN